MGKKYLEMFVDICVWNGDLTKHSLRENFLKSYAQLYLQEEIQQEALVRNIPAFSKFLDIAAANDGQLVSYSSLARECGVSTKTALGYYEILGDTFLAHRIDGWNKSVRKQLTGQPKYYFFDCGFATHLPKQLSPIWLSFFSLAR